jgi:hypothetical protein
MPPTKHVRCSKWSFGFWTEPSLKLPIVSVTKDMSASPSEKSRTRYLRRRARSGAWVGGSGWVRLG